LAPGKDGKALSRKGMVVDRKQFEKMKNEFYRLRGWAVSTGLQTRQLLVKDTRMPITQLEGWISFEIDPIVDHEVVVIGAS
jgi:hypothetical protein